MKFVRFFIVGILVSIFAMSVMDSPHAVKIPAIYNFGDSHSDTGGAAAAFYPMAAGCGETFFGRPSGRGCDGRLIIDFIAEELGIPYLSAYLNSIGANFEHGANFATGGASIRHQNESWLANGVSPFPLEIQVAQFNQFQERTTYIYNQDKGITNLPNPEDFSKALYTFDIGQNDIGAGFRNMMRDEQIRNAIPDIVSEFSTAIQKLYKKGARAFWLHNTGPIGCTPVAILSVRDPSPGHFDEHGCVKGQNDLAIEFNRVLRDKVIQLRAELPQATLTYVDIYTAKYRLISDAKNEGFENPFTICCGHHEHGLHVWCGNKGNVNGTEVYADSCVNPSAVISWDGVHFSEAANQWVAQKILNGSMSDPPIPITRATYKHKEEMF